jgi:hypothetical protein
LVWKFQQAKLVLAAKPLLPALFRHRRDARRLQAMMELEVLLLAPAPLPELQSELSAPARLLPVQLLPDLSDLSDLPVPVS